MVDLLRFQSCGLLTRYQLYIINGIILSNSYVRIIFYDLIFKMHNSVMCGGGPVSKHLGANHD